MIKELKTQWHPAFCSAMKLELKDYRDYLEYTNEYNLTSKPLQVDLLIIKKSQDVQIDTDIGRIFKSHNILEYKSPDDSLNEDSFLKVIGYACLYKADEERNGEIEMEDVSVTLIRERFPRKLFRWLREHNYQLEEKYRGIYYVFRKGDFATQVIVSKRLSKKNQKWLTLLKRGLSKEDAQRAIIQTNELTNGAEKSYADSILQVVVKENEGIFDEIKKEDERMCEALRKLMEPEFREELEKATKEVTKEVTKEIILRGIKKGYTMETISDISGASIEEIQDIVKMNN